MTDNFVSGKLKFKGVKEGKIKKKKKKSKISKEAINAEIKADTTEKVVDDDSHDTKQKDNPNLTKTRAEMAFMKAQRKNEGDKILKKAQTSHKERVEQFNEHLDNLIEHFDIPKVSWTK